MNALYCAPITLWTYLKYERPSLPAKSNHVDGNGASGSGIGSAEQAAETTTQKHHEHHHVEQRPTH